MANNEVPPWASKAPVGHHLDVLKDDKLIQKLMIDEKKCYFFGRNPQMTDVCIDHASCSRVHAMLLYHESLKKSFLVDLGSTHGTFIGSVRLEAHKPTQLQIDSVFSFGASTRKYILRERPNATIPLGLGGSLMDEMQAEGGEGALLGLPESQTELDNLTEYNTAHNRRILMLGINEDTIRKPNSSSKRKRKHITFNDDEIIINPEDVDPSVGRFRNLVQTTVLPAKRLRYETNSMGIPHFTKPATIQPIISSVDKSLQSSLYHGIPDAGASGSKPHHMDIDVTQVALGSKLGLLLPNPAPDVNPEEPVTVPKVQFNSAPVMSGPHTYEESMMVETPVTPGGPQKKKYAKESWPGRKPLAAPL